ncbi:MAG: adenylate/guanylate cyclase domain-containing protein [Deltaproteobacteria bacterium]|nr:MAG: adenylate/guanylate cyclase domain-containing protein [Deltaproteobacteria bacterium]
MKVTLQFPALLALLFVLSGCNGPRPPQASQGTLDLRKWDFRQQSSVPLSGEWTLHWGKLLTRPPSASKASPSIWKLPGTWKGYKPFKQQTSDGTGAVTFQLILFLPSKRPSLSLYLRNSHSAHRLWILDSSGKPVLPPVDSGKVGLSRQNYVPSSVQHTVVLPSKSNTLTLLWQVSNFHHAEGGPKVAPLLGESQRLSFSLEWERLFGFFLLGLMVVLAYLHFLLFAFRREERETLWFGISCVFIGIRTSLTYGFLYDWVNASGATWDLLMRLEYITTYGVLAFPMVLRWVFKEHLSPTPPRLLLGVAVVFSLFACVAPTPWYTFSMRLFHPILVVVIGFYTARLGWLFVKSRDVIVLYALLGFVVGGLSMIFDILVARNVIHASYIAPYGFLGFILFQVLVIAALNQRARRDIERFAQQLEKQSLELEQKNAELEIFNRSAVRFVPDDLLELLGKRNIIEVGLGDHTRTEMAVMFLDIRGFTTISETMTPKENFEFVNHVMWHLSPVVRKYHGFIIKYLGDGMMAVFPKQADDALNASIEMLEAVDTINKEERGEEVPLRVGIGINYGPMLLGMVGESHRMQGDVLSDAVNLAARVEGMTKMYDATILLTAITFENLKHPENYHIRELDRVKPKGKNVPVTVYEVFDNDPEQKRELKLATKIHLEEAIRLYREEKLVEALSALEEGLVLSPEDPALLLYQERCLQAQQAQQSGLNWDSVAVLQSK